MRYLLKILHAFLKFTIIGGLIFSVLAVAIIEAKLPSVEHLRDVQLQVPLRIYSSDGKLIAEYGDKRRTPVKIEDVPQDLINAILATEDIRFYSHPGVDLKGILRAAVHVITEGKKGQGGSTITMQVARNFFLSRKKTYMRKLNEILLALKIEKHLSKNEILELYLNKIYLGKRAYGVAAAAEVYYGTTIDKLTLPQIAVIAGLPQAPSTKNPINDPIAAKARREHVLKRMHYYDFITEEQLNEALKAPITAEYHGRTVELSAPHVAEMVRQTLVNAFGEKVYDLGLEVYTTISSVQQKAANKAVAKAVLEYDQRHGYRGHIDKFKLTKEQQIDSPEVINLWLSKLQEIPRVNYLTPAVVISSDSNEAKIMLQNGNIKTIEFKDMQWAGKALPNQRYGRKPTKVTDVLNTGDVIYAQKKNDDKYGLAQSPEIEASLVAMDPHTGEILALVGGYDFYKSVFNRAVQSDRQPGSSFKPFIYGAALENGFTAASIINDAPIMEKDGTGEIWRPQNHTLTFSGPTRLREGIIKSKNLVSIRLLKAVGIKQTMEFLKKFGFDEKAIPRDLSLALGTGVLSPLELAAAYSTFPNGGFKINPIIISKILDYNDKEIYKQTLPVLCNNCDEEKNVDLYAETIAPKIMSPQNAYIMSSILQDAIQSGTGRRAKRLNRKDIAGKTGTTNDQMDGWYSGFTPNIVVTTWMGFDEPKSIKEYAASTALPMWIYFMEQVLPGIPETSFAMPDGLVTIKIDPATGLLARDGQQNAIYETFTADTVPKQYAPIRSYSSSGGTGGTDNSLF